MCSGLGLDLCEISRMGKLLGDEHFMNRFFSAEEIAYVRSKGRNGAQSLAGIFAAKEAFAKALGTGIAFELKEVSVIHDEAGRPEYALSGHAAELAGKDCFHLSISHDGDMAAAVCVRESREYADPACQERKKKL